MKKLLAILFFVPCIVPAQTAVDSLRDRVAVLEQMLGKKYLGLASSELRDSLNPANTLPGGRYPYMLSDYQLRIGLQEIYDGLQNQVSGVASRLAVVESKPAPTAPPVSVVDVSFPGVEAIDPNGGNLKLRSNIFNNTVQSGLTDSFCAMIGVNGWDGGYRVLQNWNHCGSKRLPYSTMGMDSQGDFSYNWFPAESPLYSDPDAAPYNVHEDPSHPLYAPYRGQALVIAGQQRATGYLTGQPLYAGRNVMIAAQRAGQSLYFAVSPHRSAQGTPLNRALLWLEANPNFPQNPVHIVIDGELRRLRSCDVGGQRVVCF